MNNSKLIEWLLESDCPFEWEVDDTYVGGMKIRFWGQNQSPPGISENLPSQNGLQGR